MPSITTADTLSVVSVNCISDTCYVFDMGINTAGVPHLEIKGERGTRIRLRHSEMLQKDGNIDQRNIDMHLRPRNKREIIQTDEYVLKGDGGGNFYSTIHVSRIPLYRTDLRSSPYCCGRETSNPQDA